MHARGPSDAGAGFEATFGGRAEVSASAPGRVNLLGEHTDYNDGFVLPVAIPQRAHVALRRTRDRRARVVSANVPSPGGAPPWCAYEVGREARVGGWIDCIQGVTAAVAAAGHACAGFEAYVASDVPLGCGLSSSAALEVALLLALREAFGLALDERAIARLAQRAEQDFLGVPVGVMDPMAACFADATHALWLDTRSLAMERVALPAAMDLVVVSSGVQHDNADGGYAARRDECARAAAALGVASLRDLEPEAIGRALELPEPLGRRVRHVLTENARVGAGVEALRRGDVRRLGELFAESHRSMRDDYEVSIPEVDLLVDVATADPDVRGARLTGGGFGGAVVAVARAGAGRPASARIAAAYAARSGRTPRVYVPA